MADQQQRRRWRRRDRSNERLQSEAKEVRDALHAVRRGDLDAAEEAILALRTELRDEIRVSDSYVPVFLLTLVLVVGVPLGSDNAFVSALLMLVASATVILSLNRSHIRLRVLRVVSAMAVAAGVAGVFVIYAIESGHTPTVLIATSSALFAFLLFMTLPAMLRRVLTSDRVTINTLAGAIAAYLMLGLFFATLFRFVDTVSAVPFFAQKPVAASSDFEYFSFITMTTVGYGDLTPASDAARAGAVSEAIIGQVFLVTIVARVVSSLGFQYEAARTDRGSPDDASAGESPP